MVLPPLSRLPIHLFSHFIGPTLSLPATPVAVLEPVPTPTFASIPVLVVMPALVLVPISTPIFPPVIVFTLTFLVLCSSYMIPHRRAGAGSCASSYWVPAGANQRLCAEIIPRG